MKTLFLIRHAKSSWDDTALPDKDRPLDDRGRRDAPKMGKRLAKRDVKPDLILSSPARRALTTAEVIAKKLDYKLKDIVADDRLYAGEADDLRADSTEPRDERVHAPGDTQGLTSQRSPVGPLQRHRPAQLALLEGAGHDAGLAGVPGELVEQVVERRERFLVAA